MSMTAAAPAAASVGRVLRMEIRIATPSGHAARLVVADPGTPDRVTAELTDWALRPGEPDLAETSVADLLGELGLLAPLPALDWRVLAFRRSAPARRLAIAHAPGLVRPSAHQTLALLADPRVLLIEVEDKDIGRLRLKGLGARTNQGQAG